MGLQAVPAYIAATGFQHPAVLDRNILEGIFGERTGALRAGQFTLTPGVGTRAVQVSPGRYHIVGTENAQQGGYFAWNDVGDTFLLGAAVTNPRIDTLLLRIHDDQYGSIPGSPGAYWEVVQGVAAGSPTARPDSDFNVGGSFYVPGAWARISDVRVNVGDSGPIPGGQITNAERYARHNGWTIGRSFPNWPSDPVLNDHLYEFDTGFHRWYNGSTWKQIYPWRKEVTLSVAASEINITGIPTSLRTLKINFYCRTSAALQQDNMFLRVNNVSATHAYNQLIQTNTTPAHVANDQTNNHFSIAIVPSASATAGAFGGGVIHCQNWNGSASAYPIFEWNTGTYGTTASNAYNMVGRGTYFGTGPYTSLRFFPASGNFTAGSWVTVEGWDSQA